MASSKGSTTSDRSGKSRLGAVTADAIDVEEEDKRVFAADLSNIASIRHNPENA